MTIFRSDDGRAIDEADLRLLLRYVPGAVFYGNTEPLEVVKRLSAALTPKPAPTCGVVMRAVSLIDSSGKVTCALPPGHHPFVRPINTCCTRLFDDPIHSPGHMPSADSWVGAK